MRPIKPILIYNPHTSQKINKKIDYALRLLANIFPNNKIDIYQSLNVQKMSDFLVKVHEKQSHDLLISLGGDGTISSIVNCLMKIPKEQRNPLLPLPAGTGDSLVRDFQIKTINDSILNFSQTSKPILFDVLKIETIQTGHIFFCINVLGMGFVADLASTAVKYGKSLGSFSYFLGALYGIKNFKPYKTIITLKKEKEIHTFNKAYFLTVSNTKYTGGAVKIAPDAEFDDGIMDIIVLHDISRLKFLACYKDGFTGKHIQLKGCTYLKAEEIIIESDPPYYLMPDGDLGGSSPVKISVCKSEIPVYLSKGADL
ncbi:MAG: hypothetical protein MJB14_16035 [Spirochaetes bacterium]|nr:hypothetical protein [Spirochaetota bacterium]